MKNMFACLFLIFTAGCATFPQKSFFEKGALSPRDETDLTKVLAAIGERAIDDYRDQTQIRYRLSVMTSFHSFACIVVYDSGLGMVIRTRVCSGMASGKCIYDESRLLTSDEFVAFANLSLRLSRVGLNLNLSELNDGFVCPDGQTFIWEEGFYSQELGCGQKKLYLISDPRYLVLSSDKKTWPLNQFPEVDMVRLKEYVEAYSALLNWLSDMTGLDTLRVNSHDNKEKSDP